LRFVFVSAMYGYPWGGSEELWSQAALRLRDQGHDVAASVHCWPTLSPKVENLAKAGVELFVRPPAPTSLRGRVWRKIVRGIGRDQSELQWLRRQKPDLVVVSQGGNLDGLPWMKFCQTAGMPFLTIVQSNSELSWPYDDSRAEFVDAYRSARRVFCVSRHNLELLERQIGEALPNGAIVWNPYNVSRNQQPPWLAETDARKLACVARLEPAGKGQDLLLSVLARPQWRNRAVEVNFYGAGPFEEGLRRLAERLQLQNVRFRGHVSDVEGIWEQNHMLVLPSRNEGLPLALVEAMLCARPAVVTDVGGNSELCVDGETGFVAAAPAVSLLEQTLERAWNRRHEWQSMGTAARRQAERLIPIDPVGDFCREILKCMSLT
jgi:glycosyltransferase involved in cell wall biosynthesis